MYINCNVQIIYVKGTLRSLAPLLIFMSKIIKYDRKRGQKYFNIKAHDS